MFGKCRQNFLILFQVVCPDTANSLFDENDGAANWVESDETKLQKNATKFKSFDLFWTEIHPHLNFSFTPEIPKCRTRTSVVVGAFTFYNSEKNGVESRSRIISVSFNFFKTM